MFQYLPESTGNAIGFQATGMLTDEDYKNYFVPKLQEVYKTYDKCRLLIQFDSGFQGFGDDALWNPTNFGVTHRHNFEKFVIVGNNAIHFKNWQQSLQQYFTDTEFKVYNTNDMQSAWEWLNLPVAQTA